jgi:catechol 2,3-dioxygenase-like lactoylglutathione lyase family enzyme
MRFHTSLPVRDIDKTTAFYRMLFGSEPVKRRDDYVKFLPDDFPVNLSFHQNDQGPGELRALHLGFEVKDQGQLNRLFLRLEAANLVSSSRKTEVCCYANQDKFWVKDPDGYEWELYYLVSDTLEKMGPKVSCCAPGATSATEPAAASGCC